MINDLEISDRGAPLALMGHHTTCPAGSFLKIMESGSSRRGNEKNT
jgi:hypothetical protein